MIIPGWHITRDQVHGTHRLWRIMPDACTIVFQATDWLIAEYAQVERYYCRDLAFRSLAVRKCGPPFAIALV